MLVASYLVSYVAQATETTPPSATHHAPEHACTDILQGQVTASQLCATAIYPWGNTHACSSGCIHYGFPTAQSLLTLCRDTDPSSLSSYAV